jgi:hypothetical protein
MITREANAIHELTAAQLDLVTGGSITEGVRTAITYANAVAMLAYGGAYVVTANVDYHPDPWG